MTANFQNVTAAIKFLNHNASPAALALIAVLEQHAEKESPVSVVGSNGEIATMTFTSTHSVDVEMEVEGAIITIHEVNNEATATVSINPNQTKETIMNNQAQTTASTTEERDALMAKMAAMQAALDEMSKGQPDAAAKPAASAEDNDLALAIGKGVLYTAGAVAVGVGGWFAWKKWGFSSTQA